jgi:leucyl/phenylalanyl-tRNA--protein transferase
MVLFCEELRLSRSLAKSIRNKGYVVQVDTAFREVLAAARRRGATRERAARPAHGSARKCAPPMHACIVPATPIRSNAGRTDAGRWPVRRSSRPDVLTASRCSRTRPTRPRLALVALVEELRQRGFPLIDCHGGGGGVRKGKDGGGGGLTTRRTVCHHPSARSYP